jgi:serine/threonine-protein kinase
MDLPAQIGRYKVERLLGQGTTGRVLQATDPVLGRPVAIKVLRDDLDLAPELRARLVESIRDDARAVSLLSHPAMIAIHDLGDDPAVGLYLVMERLQAPTLRERLTQGPLVPAEVAQVARALGAALTYAHAAGVVHRDIAPGNIFLAPTGTKLADFAVSRPASSSLAAELPPVAAYSAPEVLASGAYGPYADQFSLALTLFEALTGARAFPGDDASVVASRVRTAKQQAPTAVAPRLKGFVHVDAIFDRALAKEPRNRFPSCEMFATVLASELEGANVFLPTPASQASIVPRSTRRWQNAVGLVALLVIAGLLILGRQAPVPGDGVSLRSVASAFGQVITAASAAPAHPSGAAHHARPPGAPSTGASAGAAGAASADAPGGTPGAPGAPGGAPGAPAPANAGLDGARAP